MGKGVYIKLDKTLIEKIDDNLYVEESRLKEVIGKERIKKKFFARTRKTEVLHDGPAIGIEGRGKSTLQFYGPFDNMSAAEKVVAEEKKSVDYIDNDFGSDIITKCYPAYEDIKFEEFFENYYCVTAVIDGYIHKIGGRRAWDKEAFSAVYENIPQFAASFMEKLIGLAKKHKRDNGDLIAIVNEILLEVSFYNDSNDRTFEVTTFSRNSKEISDLFYSGCDQYNLLDGCKSGSRKFLVRTPAPVLCLKPIKDFVKEGDFVY